MISKIANMYTTRIAPSPTGDLHIGTVRTTYFNWLAAKATKGKFILRIDDTDQKRNNPESVDVIFKSMEWLGLNFDELVYQSSRFDLYRKAAQSLIDQGFAYHKDGAIHLTIKNLINFPSCWHDEIGGDIAISQDDLNIMENMVLIKSDGSPSYNFCSIFDDLSLGVNFIIRGVDHITNTSKQIVLWNLLKGNDYPKFCHLGLICVNGKPMSKRDGASSILNYMKDNYDPDAMLNFLARLGWGPRIDDKTTALLPKEKMVELFLDGGKMRNTPSNFDIDKLNSFDRKYKARKNDK